MSAPIVKVDETGIRFLFWCPACEEPHAISTPTWEFNGDLDLPTVDPSMLVKSGRGRNQRVCHSFLRDGRWEYLADSTHDLAGRTAVAVPFPDLTNDDEG